MSATKPEAAALTDVLAAHQRVSWAERPFTCACDPDTSDATSAHTAHVAAEVSRWLRTALLGDEVVEAAAQTGRQHGYTGEYFWAVRGGRDQLVQMCSCGVEVLGQRHSEHEARAILTAALDRVEALNTEDAGT